jgi:hypothetical protein
MANFLSYFQSYENYFWEFENEIDSNESVFETLTIQNGNTIAFEKYIFDTLNLLSINELPPFGSLLLAIIATNPNAEIALNQVSEIVQKKTLENQKSKLSNIDSAFEFLSKLEKLPAKYKLTENRKQVFATIFLNCHNRIGYHNSKLILDTYNSNSNLLIDCAKKRPFSFSNFVKDFKTIELLNVKFPTSESIIKSLEGLTFNEIEISNKIIESQEISISNNFIQDLIDEPKTFFVGSLITRIWSGLNFPMHHATPSNMPLGGISDLTNKGDFDKLIISEFANDDDVFVSRIANNEALFIKREIPPEQDEFQRIILIDNSMKNWGTPKIIAFSTAIAIAKHPKTDILCKIFTVGDVVEEVAFESTDTVIEGLNFLSPKLDASKGFNLFLNSVYDSKFSEIFIILSEYSFKMTNTQKFFNENLDKIKYLIVTKSDGNISIFRNQNKGLKQIQNIILPLEELWAKKSKEKQQKDVYRNSEFPLSYPVLFPQPHNVIAKFILEDSLYFLANNKSLQKMSVRFDFKNSSTYNNPGVEILFERISIKVASCYALGKNENDEFILMSFYENDRLITSLNLNNRVFHKTTFTKKAIAKSCKLNFIDNKFYMMNLESDLIWELQLKSGLIVCESSFGKEIISEYVETQKMINDFRTYGMNIITNISSIFIDDELRLYINKYMLTLSEPYNAFSVNRNYKVLNKSTVKGNKFIFSDNSEIVVDKRGILKLISSNDSIPEIYIPLTKQFHLGMAAGNDFTGNKYYFNDNVLKPLNIIPSKIFEKKYIIPFIDNIVNHGN